jgi:sn-glycerol 3-phosphate transport system ATP-binding protein
VAGVDLHEVHKSFGRTEVIKGVSTTIDDGEMRVVLGPSGCGKSTVLRMIAGLEAVSAGTIRIGARVVNDLEPKDRDIAMVFQNYALYPHMSVYDNMAYGLRNRGTPKPEIQRRVGEAARILGLADLLERKPRQLSGGQRQRVAMGRAIVREPAAFLFDEPLSNLDAKLRVQMRIEIKQLQQRLGTTGIYVTHDQVEAMTLGDRLMVMNAGRVEQTGTPLEVYERPASVFVAGFIGSPGMNLLDAAIAEDGRHVLVDGTRLALHQPCPSQADRPVVLGLRPEHLTPLADECAGLPLEVALVEMLGADTVVHGQIPSSRAPLTTRVHGTSPLAPGDRVRLVIEPRHLHLFEPVSGRRIDV